MHYFDYNATTSLAREVADAMIETLTLFGNPSSVHSAGQATKRALAEARTQVADAVGAAPQQVVFTSGGTEANNLAIKGWLERFRGTGGHVITSAIEHPSVLAPLQAMARHWGFEISELPVDGDGRIAPQALRAALRPDTRLLAFVWANNEIGTLQPVAELTTIAHEAGVQCHVDAVQAMGKVPVDVAAVDVDSLSISAHKFHGPKGVGALYLRRPTDLHAILDGGGQEQGVRSGTENIIGIVGMARACALLQDDLAAEMARQRSLKDLLLERLRTELPEHFINGPAEAEAALANTVNVGFPGVRGEALAAMLDAMHRIGVSVGSACSHNKQANLSHVLRAIRRSDEQIRASIRISFGRYTCEEDITNLVDALGQSVDKLRTLAGRPAHPLAATAPLSTAAVA